MKSRLDQWFNVGPVASLPVGEIYPISVEERDLILVRLEDGSVYCCVDACAHQPVKLSEFGEVVGSRIHCHAHGAQFDLCQSGKNLCFPAVEPLAMVGVKLQGGDVFINLIES